MKIKVVNNGYVYPLNKSIADKLEATVWIEEFIPPNDCIGTIINKKLFGSFGTYYLLRFSLTNIKKLIPVSPRRDIYFNYKPFYKFLDTGKEFIDVIMSRDGFKIEEEDPFFSVDEFLIQEQ